MVSKLKIAIIGYGNVGRFAFSAVQATHDMDLAQVVITDPHIKTPPLELTDAEVVFDLGQLKPDIDVALLCLPSRIVPDYAEKILNRGINTVDPYDVHSDILVMRSRLLATAQKNNAVAVISAGWDPGTDSIVRVLMEVMAPHGITYTNFGPGMSMGHSVAVKALPGVLDALAITIPKGTGLHRRMVYVELQDGIALEGITAQIKQDPYFAHDETYVFQVPSVNALKDVGHAVFMERKGVSGDTHNQLFSFNMKINNPALTSQAMVASARASKKQAPGVYTMIEIPVIDYLPGKAEDIIAHLV